MINFKINVQIQRPAIYESSASNALRAKHPSSSSSVRSVPAGFQYVEVYQNTTFGKFIGGAYTDAEGTLDSINFSVSDHYPEQIFLKVYGDSLWGFRVGWNNPLELLDSAYAWQWDSPWINAGDAVVDVGALCLGKFGNSWAFLDHKTNTPSENNKVNSFRAAALFEILDMIYQELDISYLVSNWIINDVVADMANSTQPWVYWKTVHIRDDLSTDNILWQAPHELGHILYNMNHSGKLHYDVEDWMDYLHDHNACSNIGSNFGHYEGYAHAFRNLFWRHHAQRNGAPDYNTPSDICSNPGIAREGNVNEFYCYAFAGKPMERPPESLYNWTTHLIGANKYAFPPTTLLFDIVSNFKTEDLNQMWIYSMNGMCSGNIDGVPSFCSSRRFKYLVENDMLSITDAFPPDFKNVNGLPGKSNIINTTISAGSIQVEFTSAEFVNAYEILMEPTSGSAVATAVDANQFGNEILSQVVSVPNCDKVKLSVVSYNDNGSTKGDTIEVYTACQMTKPVINNVSCSYCPPREGIKVITSSDYEAAYDENVPDDNSLPELTELPGIEGGFDCEISFTPSAEAEEHRYALTRMGYETKYGPWMKYSDNIIYFFIKDTEKGTNQKVAVQARKMNTKVTSEWVQLQLPDVPYPRLTLEMKPKLFIAYEEI